MEKIINVDIKDFDTVKHFRIRLFDVMPGLEFIDTLVGSKPTSIKPYLKDLLPLATLLDEKGNNPICAMDLSTVETYFQNPLSVLELGIKIFEHQMVFMKESEVFQPYLTVLEKQFHLPTLDSVTQ